MLGRGRWNGEGPLAELRAQRVQLETFPISHAEASLADAADLVAPPFHRPRRNGRRNGGTPGHRDTGRPTDAKKKSLRDFFLAVFFKFVTPG